MTQARQFGTSRGSSKSNGPLPVDADTTFAPILCLASPIPSNHLSLHYSSFRACIPVEMATVAVNGTLTTPPTGSSTSTITGNAHQDCNSSAAHKYRGAVVEVGTYIISDLHL